MYVGDPGSKIPNTYLKKDEITGPGMYPPGTVFYQFRDSTFDPQTETEPNVAEIWVTEKGIVRQFRWYATDRGIKIGSSATDAEKAYADAERRTCKLSSGAQTPYFIDKNDRVILFIIRDDKVWQIRAVGQPTTEFCGFE